MMHGDIPTASVSRATTMKKTYANAKPEIDVVFKDISNARCAAEDKCQLSFRVDLPQPYYAEDSPVISYVQQVMMEKGYRINTYILDEGGHDRYVSGFEFDFGGGHDKMQNVIKKVQSPCKEIHLKNFYKLI